MQKIAIVGSRSISFEDSQKVREYIDNLPKDAILISGGASGVDTVAHSYAKNKFIFIVVHPAWDRDGKSAGVIRNKTICDLADRVVAFWDGKSNGTLSCINQAKLLGKDVEIIYITKG